MTVLYRLALRLLLPGVHDRHAEETVATAAQLAEDARQRGRIAWARCGDQIVSHLSIPARRWKGSLPYALGPTGITFLWALRGRCIPAAPLHRTRGAGRILRKSRVPRGRRARRRAGACERGPRHRTRRSRALRGPYLP